LAGPAEQAIQRGYYWQPFWTGRVRHSVTTGRFLKSGAEQVSVVLLDATAADQVLYTVVPGDHPLGAGCQYALRNPTAATKFVCPPVIGQATAERMLRSVFQTSPELSNARAELDGIVYLPMCHVTFEAGKGTARPACFSLVQSFKHDNRALSTAT